MQVDYSSNLFSKRRSVSAALRKVDNFVPRNAKKW
jgi:hypothetical protein